jgi:2-polyprenyl-3-methyl-5-hydroxy-6-metoxy-1,4-benzoquinol methylase
MPQIEKEFASLHFQAEDIRTLFCPLCSSGEVRHIFAREFRRRRWYLAACKRCGLKFTDPKPTSDDVADFYSGSYHGGLRNPGTAEKAHRERFAQFTALIVKHCPPPARTLDIGCSTGLFPATLRRKGYDAEGIERNPESALWGSKHYGITIHTDPLEAGGYPSAAYDLVSLTDVLEHTLHPVEFLKHVKRILKPRGYALVTFPDIESLQMRYSLFLANLLRRPDLCISQIPHHTWEFSRSTAIACFDRAGFEVLAFRRRQPLMSRWPLKAVAFEIPCWLLSLPPLPQWFGLRMQFIIRKRSEDCAA